MSASLSRCMAEILLFLIRSLSLVLFLSPNSQVQKVLQFHRELPREELHAAPTNRAAAEAPLHPRPAQRAAGPHTAQRPHRPDEEKEGRERCVCFSIIMKGWKSVGCISCEWLVFVLVQMRRNMSTVAVRRRKRILLSKKESPGMFYTCSVSLKGNKCTCSGGGVSQTFCLFLTPIQLNCQRARWIYSTAWLHPPAAGEQGEVGGAPSPAAPPGAATPGARGVQAPTTGREAETYRATEGAEKAVRGGRVLFRLVVSFVVLFFGKFLPGF